MRRLRIFWLVILILAVSAGGFCLWLSDKYVVPIMMYHNVEAIDEPQPNWVSPQRFEWHMQYLKNNGYRVIRLDKLVEVIKSGKPIPRKTVVITFDDGRGNNYTQALKILKKYRFPAIIFVPSAQLGKKGYLTWKQLKEMVKAGVDVGSHTRSEAYLPDLSSKKQKNEITESKRILERNLGINIDYFAYPIGGFSEGIKRIVKEAGYKGACATNRGYDRMNKDVYELNRIRFSDKDDRLDYLWMKLSGYYNLFRQAKKPY